MYLTYLKTVLNEAVKRTFDADYPEGDFRSLHVSTEFPILPQHYPGIWVDYNPVGPLQVMGIDHHEYANPSANGHSRRFTRWRFQGEASFTLVAMSSLERDRLHDEMIRVLAFGSEAAQTSEFRTYIEDNEFLAVNFDFDEITTRGWAATMGTPWQSDDMIYECEVSMECFGEFVSDQQSQSLAPITAIEFIPIAPEEADTTVADGRGEWI